MLLYGLVIDLYKFEMHVHTAECDKVAMVDGAEMVRMYAHEGYSGMVVTDHYFAMFEERFFPEIQNVSHEDFVRRWLKGYYNARNEGEKIGFTVLSGAEVRLDSIINDYLVYGVEEDFFYKAPRLNRLSSVSELISALPDDAVVVQAHPFRNNMVICDPSPLFGIEAFNGGTEDFRNEMAKTFAAHYNKPVTSGSDYHGKKHFASGGIATETKILTQKDLIKTLRNGNYKIIERGNI